MAVSPFGKLGTDLAHNCIASVPNPLATFKSGLALADPMKHWTLTSLHTSLIKTRGRLVRRGRKLVFQLAAVVATREILGGMLERIDRAWLAPG